MSKGDYGSLNLGPLSGDDPALVRQNWDRLRQDQGWESRDLALPRLCHGAACVEASEDPEAPHPSGRSADAVYTRSDKWVLAVTMADCLPILIADPVMRCVAAVHAGWRGTRDQVLHRTLQRLFAAEECHPASTFATLGPCLSTPALEISAEVARTLPTAHLSQDAGRYYFDLIGANRAQALLAGLPAENIYETGMCTHENGNLFFSYRRDRGTTGRMAACIGLI